MQRFLLLIVFTLLGLSSFAQKDARLTPGLSPVEDLPIEQMPQQDNQALLDAELARRGPGIAPRYATNLEVVITPATHGQWETTANGSTWRVRIQSPRAYSLNFGFSQYVMPTGGQLVIYRSDYQEVRGPFTPADNEEHEQLWTPLVEGDDLVIEVTVPTEAVEELELKLTYVNHAFQNFSALISGSCNLDVICGAADGWGIVDPHRDIIQSVAVISTGGGTFCTGFLVNSVEDDCTPFFMTANHCGINSGNAASLVTYWNYQNSTCRQPNSSASGGVGDGQLNDFNTGAIFRASRSASDFVLVELDDPVSSTANAYFAGWDARGVGINSAIGVHHPRTDEKRISFENDPTQFTTYGSGTPTSNYTHVRVIDWDVGTTEGGSSGSPLFDQNERVVGQLHGGGAACGNNSSDWYGSFAVSWDAGGNSSSRLRDWLDPDNTGTLFINGRWANECNFSISATPLEQSVCQPDEAFYDITASTGFTGSASLDLDGLPFGTYDFSPGNVSPGSTSTLTVETGSLDPGIYNFTVIGTNGGNSTEVNLSLTVLPGSSFPPDLLEPADDSNGVFPNPALSWNGDDSGATTYTVQIATDASFSNIIETGTTNATSYQPTNASEGLTRYYWRVSASNDCGSSGFSFPFSFITADVTCVTYTSDFSTTISSSGTPTVTNDIFFAEDLTIASVIVGMEVTHSYVGDLEARVFPAPNGTVELFDRPGFPTSEFGCSEDNLLLSFSSTSPNSANDLDNTCNPSDTGPNNPGAPYAIEGSYRPISSFDFLVGSSSLGAWTLEIGDNVTADGGVLEEWFVTVCYEVESTPPIVEVNEIFPVPHSTEETITDQYLLASDAESGPADLTFTLNFLPAEGTLRRNGQVLGNGDSFTQADINNGLVTYTHDGGDVLVDDFGFDVTNAAGMSVEGNIFNIEIIVEPLTAGISQTANVQCNGGNQGAITVTAIGGVPPYQYALNNGTFQSGSTFSGLTAGTYFATVQDVLGTEISTTTITITQPTALSATASVTNNTITISASGGTPAYLYALNGGTPQSSNTFNGVANGDHIIQVTDANGCTTNVSATVAVNNIMLIASLVREISCHDADDAIISALASGGVAPYQYRINNGTYGDASIFTNLGPGVYSVQVRDQEGFERLASSITITNPALLTVSATVDSDEISVAAGGGMTPYLYQLDGGVPQASPIFTDVTNGDHTITVIDDNDCTATTSVTVAVNTLMVSALLVNDISCNNANDGSLTVNVSGGTPNYSYSLDGDNFQSSSTFTDLAAGTYTVTVLDSEGFTSTTNSVTITNPSLLTASAAVNDDDITVTASGGTPPLLYQLGSGTPQISPLFTGIANGTYVITVIDRNDCTTTTMATVAVNTMSVSAILVNDISCNNVNDGSLTVNVSGGTPNYSYSLDGENFQPSSTFTGLAAGTYTVTVMDSEGFIGTTNTVTITNPPVLTASATVNSYDITVTASGGTPPLLYQLGNGTPQTSPLFTDVANGTYVITVSDGNDCTTTTAATVAVNTLVVSAALVNDISCNNANDGQLMASVNGGTPGYLYSLNGVDFQSSPFFNDLAAGTYTVVVLDSEGFTRTTNNVTITNPTLLTANAAVDEDAITVTADGGTTPYMYQLGSGVPQVNPNFTEVPNGIYMITVIDNNGCTTTTTVTIAVNTLMVALLTQDISCNNANDGQLMANVNGGTAPFLYSLDGENYQDSPLFTGLSAATYTVTVLDSEGFTQTSNTGTIINPAILTVEATVLTSTVVISAEGGTPPFQYQIDDDDIQASPAFLDLPNGTYTFTVYDANNCTMTVVATIAVNTLIVSAVLSEDISCHNVNDGEISVMVQGGTPPYQYSLDGENYQDENTFTGLSEGTYIITVLDSEGFLLESNNVVVTNPVQLTLEGIVEGSTVTAVATGGTGFLTYSINGINFQENTVFTDVPDGIYQLSVRDANGCVTAMEVIVAVNSLLASVQDVQGITCFGAADGTLTVNASGGISPYTYSLDGENFQEENIFTGLPPGEYEVTVQDAIGTTFTTTAATLVEPEEINLTLVTSQDSIISMTTGGTAPYIYSINGSAPQNSPIFADLMPGGYEVTVEDANGCSTTSVIDILVGIFTPARQDLEFSVYPNPNNGQFQLLLSQVTGRKLDCQIYNTAGELIWQQRLDKPGLQLRQSFDLQWLPSGLYQIVVYDGNSFGVARVIVLD